MNQHPASSLQTPTACVILAAGKGTRMKSDKAKVLHHLAGKPLVCHVVERALSLGCAPVVVVVGHQADTVREVLSRAFGDKVQFVEQTEQLGTAHAVLQAKPVLADFNGQVLILSGDVPCLTTEMLQNLMNRTHQAEAKLGFVTAMLDDPFGYGRILRDESGQVVANVEQRDASPEQQAIRETNAGIYLAEASFLFPSLECVDTDNDQKEYYLPDLIALAAREQTALAVEADAEEIQGVNTRAHLARLETRLRQRINHRHMEQGVTLLDPNTTYLDADVRIGPDTVLGPNVHLRGACVIGSECRIDTGCVLVDTVLEDHAELRPYCVTDRAHVESHAVAGPFARLRPKARMCSHSHVGNFVELKNTVLGEGSKASHLSYLGDAEIGKQVNIGAGTITCNYDGYGKHKTEIGDGSFVGSDTQFIAPVRIGNDVTVAAGTTVTKDVPDGHLVLSRVEQHSVEGYTAKKRQSMTSK